MSPKDRIGLRRRRPDATQPEVPSDLNAELLLLREENRRLKAIDGRADLVRLVDRTSASDDADDAASLLAECLLARESLLEACRSLRTLSAELEARLQRVPIDA
ncbi:MAG TPA: hypothetical protein VNS09_25765 [Solirubrobacter sp.]|nr:hypothetical protein [Solirubrobacter sp.]